MNMSDAQQIALRYVKDLERESGCELALIDSATIERSFGWVFFYDSRRHIQTGNIRDAIAGNAPFVITRADGNVHETGTAQPLEHYLEGFAK
jgi:hypothetical protein